MSESFSVGEIVLVVGATRHPENIGQEMTVVRPYGMRRASDTGAEFMGYGIERADGVRFAVRPQHIRKRRPPQDWVKLCHLTDLPREVTHV